MSSEKELPTSSEGRLPSNEEIIDDVVESCKRLNVNSKKVPGFEKNDDDDDDDETEATDIVNNLDGDDDYVDDVYLKDLDVSSSPEELQKRKQLAAEMKELGNDLFKNGEFESARKKYSEALRTCPFEFSEERSILFANRGAAKLKNGLKKEAIEDCTKAIELNPKYVKAYIRRAKLYEETDKLEEALEDYKKILEFDSQFSEARAATMRLPNQIQERNEKLKKEMLGSLKELGQKVLKPFGLSMDNFQVQQDPNSGGYHINFVQNKK